MSEESHNFLLAFFKELFFNFNDKTNFTENDKIILKYFVENLRPEYNNCLVNYSLIVKEQETLKEALCWAYHVFLCLLYNEPFTNGCTYRDVIKSESFNNLLFSLQSSTIDYSRLVISNISIDFSSLVKIITDGNFKSGCDTSGCWSIDFYNSIDNLERLSF
ncbi:MAG: hypothetical protein ACXWEW_04850 [Nitrososphaeraceae archaeon]